MKKQFEFFLDAWKYCLTHNIPFDPNTPFEHIKKVSFKVWEVEIDEQSESV